MKAQVALTLFAIASAICLLGRLLDSSVMDYVSKPFLMPSLYFYYLHSTKAYKSPKATLQDVVLIALFFAWLGDILLMLAKGNQLLFICGLLAFLVMQILYLRMYLEYSDKHEIIFKSKPHLALPSILLGVGFYYLLLPNLDSILTIAVGVYAIALVSMTLGAINRWKYSEEFSFQLTTIGAFSFMFSDMMIGYNNFLLPFPLAGFWIMITYILGQFLIIKGIIVQYQYNLQ